MLSRSLRFSSLLLKCFQRQDSESDDDGTIRRVHFKVGEVSEIWDWFLKLNIILIHSLPLLLLGIMEPLGNLGGLSSKIKHADFCQLFRYYFFSASIKFSNMGVISISFCPCLSESNPGTPSLSGAWLLGAQGKAWQDMISSPGGILSHKSSPRHLTSCLTLFVQILSTVAINLEARCIVSSAASGAQEKVGSLFLREHGHQIASLASLAW